jgi:4'-phosphopantetheinyl transferase
MVGNVARSLWWLARSVDLTPDTDEWLTPAENAYAERQRYTKRRSEFRTARYAAKTAIARALDLGQDARSLARIEIRHEPSGAPYACVDGRPAGWQLSLTDRADWAVCLVSSGVHRVGCDLELVEPRSAAFVADFLTPAEQRCVAAHPDADLAANVIWSAKESALKVLTTGLRRDTRSVEIELYPSGGGWGRLRLDAAEGMAFSGWWRQYGSFVLTVASAAPADAPAALEEQPLLDRAAPSHRWLQQPLR